MRQNNKLAIKINRTHLRKKENKEKISVAVQTNKRKLFLIKNNKFQIFQMNPKNNLKKREIEIMMMTI